MRQASAEGHLKRAVTGVEERQPGTTHRDALLEQSEELLWWLYRAAHVYLCGDKARLTDVEKALQERVDTQAGRGHWKQLSKAKRLHRNLY